MNLNAEDRFIPTKVVRDAYLHYSGSRHPEANPYLTFEDSNLELGVVDSAVPEIARGVSSLLCRSLEGARNELGGHLPTCVVRRVQREIISPEGVANLWGSWGHRFVLSQPAGDGMRELVATILVGDRRQTIFFFTGRYNNLLHSTITDVVDFEQPDSDDPTRRWFDRFKFPPMEKIKPRGYHHIANFVVAKEHRGRGLATYFLRAIYEGYSRKWLDAHSTLPRHSQRLMCGRGFWLIGDPPWLPRMERLGFRLRQGAESFFIEHDWALLPAIYDEQGNAISNLEYNTRFGLPRLYEERPFPGGDDRHLEHRIPEVIRLSQDPRAKLQYFQMMWDF